MMDTDKIVFMDIQFCNGVTTPTNPNILTIGLVSPTVYNDEVHVASEFYLEIEPTVKVDEWVRSNIMSSLHGEFIPEDMAKKLIIDFCKSLDTKPYVISDTHHFNWIALCNLFGVRNIPFHYPPLCFETLLWHYNIDPSVDRHILASNLGIDVKYLKPFYSVDNAKLLLAIYYALQNYKGKN